MSDYREDRQERAQNEARDMDRSLTRERETRKQCFEREAKPTDHTLLAYLDRKKREAQR